MLSILTDITAYAKHFVARYYPRNHLYMAGILGILIIGLLALPNKDEAPSNPNRVQIPVTTGISTVTNLATEVGDGAPDELLTTYAVGSELSSTTVPATGHITRWQNIPGDRDEKPSASSINVGR